MTTRPINSTAGGGGGGGGATGLAGFFFVVAAGFFFVSRCLRERALEARRSLGIDEHRHASSARDAAVDQGCASPRRRSIEQVLCSRIVRCVDYDRARVEVSIGIAPHQAIGVCRHFAAGGGCGEGESGRLDFSLAEGRIVKEDLPLKIRRLDAIIVDEGQPADAGSGEGRSRSATERAHTDDQRVGAFERIPRWGRCGARKQKNLFPWARKRLDAFPCPISRPLTPRA